MKYVFLKDMAYRRARIVLTIISVACLVALILLMGGIMKGLRMQARDYVESVEQQAETGTVWLSTERSGSTFAGFSLLNSEHLEILRSLEGVDKDIPLSPIIFAQARPVINGKETKAVVVGYQKGKLGGPSEKDKTDPNAPFYPIIGRLFQSSQYEDYRPMDIPPGEVIVDELTGLEIGQNVELAGKPLRVVGKTRGKFFVFDTPLLFMDIRTAQETVLSNVIYVNTVLVKVAEGYNPLQLANEIKERSTVRVDAHTGNQIVEIILANYVDEPMKGVQALRIMLWIATGLIVAMITYVTTREKIREIGVLKAIGASDKYVVSLILKQVVIMTLAGIILGIILAYLAAGVFPIMVVVSTSESLLVAVITMAVCLYGGYIAAKRAASVDPMIAFRGR
ncbi:FtsX-like permease family protein [Candidatus Poribacteria bacterium]|nr:FtsX-like permease family protein [Candidatus Poribacteria bacterium]